MRFSVSEPSALLERSIHRMALAIACVLALSIPAGYFIVTYLDHTDSLDFKAKVKAAALSSSIASNPETWMFAENRLQGLISREPVALSDELVQVFDKDNGIVTQVGGTPPKPLLSRSHPLYDADRLVGRIVVVGSARGLAWGTLASALFGLLFGAAVYAVVRVLPARELRAATAALSASELRFRSLFENAPNVAVQGYDAERRVIYWNAASEHLYGYTAAEAFGQDLATLIIPDAMRPGVSAAISAWRDGGPAIPASELTLQRKDGSPVVVFSSHVMLLSAAGQPEMYCIDVELTELKRTEAELRSYQQSLEQKVEERTTALTIAKEAAEAANRAKTTFLANMSHELRTPMNAIIGMTAIVLRGTTDRRQIDQLTKVTNAAQNLLGIIGDILDISKIEAERFSLERVDFTLAVVLESLSNLVVDKAVEKGLKLMIEVPPGLASQVFNGDRLRLGQILLNLVGNAIKFTPAGSVTLRLEVSEDLPTQLVLRFEVRDTGIGISAPDQQRVFSAFEQADGSMTRRYGGTGLGLAISKRLAQMMGGTMGVESALGEGSLFWFTARIDKSSAAAPDADQAEASAEARLRSVCAGRRILLVEDEPVNQEVSRWLLEDVGLAVDLAEDGQRALEMAQQGDYALILMDVQLPKMNGFDAARAIRALPGGRDLPILAITAHVFEEGRQGCLDAGMNDHIGKPVEPQTLYATLLKWLAPASS